MYFYLEQKYIVSIYPTDNTDELNLICKHLEETSLLMCLFAYEFLN